MTKATARLPLKLETREVIVFDKIGNVATIIVAKKWGREIVIGGHYAPDWWAKSRQCWKVADADLNKADTLSQHLQSLRKRGYVHLLPDNLLAKDLLLKDEELIQWMKQQGISTKRRYPQ